MDATTEVEVFVDERGHSVVQRMRCEAPLLVRVVDGPADGLTLAIVNGAAGPVGGDRLTFALRVGPGARVTVRSVAASMAHPGATGQQSTLTIELAIGTDAMLDWAPQPIVSVAGSDHRTVVAVSAASSSTVTISEGVSLGRHGEPPGRLALRQRVVIDDAPVLDHETVFAAGALSGPGGQGTGRTITSTVTIGAELPAPIAEVTPTCARATFHLSPLCALSVSTR